MSRYRYEVRGSGPFPADMLRYDQCWPQSSEFLGDILDQSPTAPRRRVVLESHKRPTPGRWDSFGWYIYTPEEKW